MLYLRLGLYYTTYTCLFPIAMHRSRPAPMCPFPRSLFFVRFPRESRHFFAVWENSVLRRLLFCRIAAVKFLVWQVVLPSQLCFDFGVFLGVWPHSIVARRAKGGWRWVFLLWRTLPNLRRWNGHSGGPWVGKGLLYPSSSESLAAATKKDFILNSFLLTGRFEIVTRKESAWFLGWLNSSPALQCTGTVHFELIAPSRALYVYSVLVLCRSTLSRKYNLSNYAMIICILCRI